MTTPDSPVPPMAAGAPPVAAPATFAPTREIAAPAGSGRGPRASLQEIGGSSRRWQLRVEGTLIGRDVGPDGILIEDALASREHAEIRFENGVFVLHDLGATNPTHVNGEECSGRCQLRTGDELIIGGTTLIFEASQ